MGASALSYTFANMAGEAFKVVVPMHGQEIVGAIGAFFVLGAEEVGAVVEEVVEPVESGGSACHGGQADLDAHLLQGHEIGDPGAGGVLRGDTAAARVVDIGLVEAQDAGDVPAILDVADHAVTERGVVKVVQVDAPHHGDELELFLRQVGEGRARVDAIVVVPGQLGSGLRPDLVVLRVVCIGSEAETALWMALRGGGEGKEEGQRRGEAKDRRGEEHNNRRGKNVVGKTD